MSLESKGPASKGSEDGGIDAENPRPEGRVGEEMAKEPPAKLATSLTMRFAGARGAEEPDGTWLRGTWLLTTSTAQPTLLGLPFAMAALGWAGGIVVLVVSAVVTAYCNLLLAGLHHHGGMRHEQYRTLAKAIMGPRHKYAYHTVLLLQFAVIIGVGVANLILAATCLESIYGLYCTGDGCTVSNAEWTMVAGAALMVLSQCPDMARAEVLTAVTTFFMVTYTVAATALAGTQGGGVDASYQIPGSTVNRVMNGFNAIGIAVFVYTNNIIPEIQATLRADPKTGSAYPPMRRSILATYSLVSPLYLVVAIVGYWAYGNTVSGFLLTMSTHPAWLLIILNLMCTFQLLVGEQVFEFCLYDSWEPRLVRRLQWATWLHTEKRNAEGRRILVPNRLCMVLVRWSYIAVITLVAASFPFFSEVMGFVGAVGLTPLAFIFPIILHLVANGGQLRPAAYWGNVALAALFTGVGLLATVGAVRAIVLAIQQHDFYS